MLPLTRQEQAVVAVLAGVILIGSAGRVAGKRLPPVFRKADFIARSSSRPKLDVNTASVDDLVRLPHIGPARARAIVAFREANGPFREPAQIRVVPGIGPKLFERISPLIEVRSEP